MKGKLALIIGLGAGYVLGARAGRARYNQICKIAEKVWNAPLVQCSVETVSDFAESRYDDAREFVGAKVGEVIAGKRKSSKPAAKKPAARKKTTTAKTKTTTTAE